MEENNKMEEINILDIISRLSNLDRLKIHELHTRGQWSYDGCSGEYVDKNGIYARWKDIESLLNEIQIFYEKKDNKNNISNVLSIKEVADKYGEEVKCMFFDYDNEWRQKTMVVNASFLRDMENGSIKDCERW